MRLSKNANRINIDFKDNISKVNSNAKKKNYIN